MVTAVVVTAVALGTTWLPLGVTSEWVWARIPTDFLLAGGVAVAAICGVVFVMFSILGLRRIDHCSATERFGWLLALPVAAFVWQGSLLDSSLPPYGYARTPWVLYYPRSSGYFWQARYEVNDAKEFLETYEELLAERDYLHIGTHPPGLTLGYLGLMQLLRTLPGLTDVVLSTAPESVHEGVEMIRAASVNGAGPLAPADEACLWLASLITQFSAVLTAIIVYLLAARHGNRRSAWLAAVSWTLVPSVLVFLPKSDVLFPFLATLATWLWLTALDRRSIARAIIAGLVLWSGMLLSLAFVTIAALIGVMTSWELFSARRETTAERVRAALWPALGFAAGFLLPLAAVWMWSGLNLLNVWSWNLSNHALFYEHNTRTWWAWLLVNPWELGFVLRRRAAQTGVVETAVLGNRRVRARLGPALAFGEEHGRGGPSVGVADAVDSAGTRRRTRG